MVLIEILLPVFDNAERKFSNRLFDDVRKELTERFGGVTAFSRAPAHGEAKNGGRTVHDDIVVLEIMVDAIDRTWWEGFRRSLEREFAQDEIVIRATDCERL